MESAPSPGCPGLWWWYSILHLPRGCSRLVHSLQPESNFAQPQANCSGPITVLRMLAEAGRSARARRASFRAALGIGVGPFWGSCQDTSAKLEILRSLHWLSVRDNESKETCVINGLHAARLGADLAFLYPAVGQHVEYRSNEVIVVPRSSPMDQDWARWESAVVRSLRSLSAENIVILSLCERDAHVAHALALRTMARVEKWDPSHMRFEDIIFRLSSARLVISARYHGALVSAAAGVPTIILGLDQKLHSLGNQLPTAKVLTNPGEVESKTVEFVDKAQQLSLIIIRIYSCRRRQFEGIGHWKRVRSVKGDVCRLRSHKASSSRNWQIIRPVPLRTILWSDTPDLVNDHDPNTMGTF